MSDSWYAVGEEAVEAMIQASAASNRKSRRNFFTQKGESARIRFLARASDSFAYKRAFVKWAQGQKLLTSPDVSPNPFIEAGLNLQLSFAWPILDKREIEIEDKETGEKKKIGPRVLYFADGQRTRKQLIQFEKEMLAAKNEELQEEEKDPLTLDEYNLTSYDIVVSKPQGAPWNFVQRAAKPLTEKEKEIVQKYQIDLKEELKPLPLSELRALLNRPQVDGVEDEDGETLEYSYSSESDDVIKFS